MIAMAQKIKVSKSSTDGELVHICKRDVSMLEGPRYITGTVRDAKSSQILCKDCELISWISPTTEPPTKISPPELTVAVVVNISQEGGAIRIFDTPGDGYVDGVGTEDVEKLVIVPWSRSWWYYSIGSLRIGYLVERKT